MSLRIEVSSYILLGLYQHHTYLWLWLEASKLVWREKPERRAGEMVDLALGMVSLPESMEKLVIDRVLVSF